MTRAQPAPNATQSAASVESTGGKVGHVSRSNIDHTDEAFEQACEIVDSYQHYE